MTRRRAANAACLAFASCVTEQRPGDRPLLPAFFALSVRDLDSGVAWYRETFDLPAATRLPIPDSIGAGALLVSPGLIIELLQLRRSRDLRPAGGAELSYGIFKMGFGVPALDPVLARLRARGTAPVAGPFDDSAAGVRAVIVADNEGNLVQVVAPRRRP